MKTLKILKKALFFAFIIVFISLTLIANQASANRGNVFIMLGSALDIPPFHMKKQKFLKF